jgi:hypothetical protein
MMVNSEITVYWDMKPWNLSDKHQLFRETWCLHLQGGGIEAKDRGNKFF